MAATYGTETAPALEAIQSLLRGQANPIERYAVGITEATIKMKANGDGTCHGREGIDGCKKKRKYALRCYFRADCQSHRVDLQKNLLVLEVRQKITTAEVKNMAISIGQDLLPIASEILGVMSNVAKNINSIDPATRKNYHSNSWAYCCCWPAYIRSY